MNGNRKTATTTTTKTIKQNKTNKASKHTVQEWLDEIAACFCSKYFFYAVVAVVNEYRLDGFFVYVVVGGCVFSFALALLVLTLCVTEVIEIRYIECMYNHQHHHHHHPMLHLGFITHVFSFSISLLLYSVIYGYRAYVCLNL